MVGELTWQSWLAGALGAALVGLAKGGLPGVGNLAIPLYAFAFGGKPSVGLLLPVLVCADISAVWIYRREARWPAIWRLLPITLVGVLVGWALFDAIPSESFARWVGVILLLMVGAHFLRQHLQGEQTPEQVEALGRSWIFRGVLGLGVGTATMLANAAGPLGAVYLMALRMPKMAFLGTAAWFFFMLNLAKIPLQVQLGVLTLDSLSLSLSFGPFAVLGALLGPRVAQRMPQSAFSLWIWITVVLAALKLLL